MGWAVWVVLVEHEAFVFSSQNGAEAWVKSKYPASNHLAALSLIKKCRIRGNEFELDLKEDCESVELMLCEKSIDYNYGHPVVEITARILLTAENQSMLENIEHSHIRLIVS